MAIVVIPHPGGVVRIPEQLVTGEEEGVWHLALDSCIGGLLHAATQRNQRQQPCQTRDQKRLHSILLAATLIRDDTVYSLQIACRLSVSPTTPALRWEHELTSPRKPVRTVVDNRCRKTFT